MLFSFFDLMVASPRIELGFGASETLVLSIVLRSHFVFERAQSYCFMLLISNCE